MNFKDELSRAIDFGGEWLDQHPVVVRDRQDQAPAFAMRADLRERRLRQLATTSTAYDLECLTKLRLEVAGERWLTQRGILNVLLAEWLDLSPEQRRYVKDKALEWEREMRP